MKIGMGWLGWTEEQVLRTSMPAIEQAYEGRIDMFGAIFGKKDDQQVPKDHASNRPMSPELFDALFGGNR